LPECAAPVVSGWWASRGGDKPGTAAVWLALARVKTACVWVTDPSPAGLSRTLEAMTAAEKCGLPMRQFVVAVNDSRGHGWASRSRSRRTLLAAGPASIDPAAVSAPAQRMSWHVASPAHPVSASG
jgi:hypothetical protein